MRKITLLVWIGLGIALAADLQAQLQTRAEIISDQYQKEKTAGILRLNQKYLALYQKELSIASANGKLEQSNEILKKIEELKAENRSLTQSTESSRAKPEDLLVGKTISYFGDKSDKTPLIVNFGKNGSATFIGLNKASIAYSYEPTRRHNEFIYWNSVKKKPEGGWSIKVSSDGKTGTVSKLDSNFTANAEITDTP